MHWVDKADIENCIGKLCLVIWNPFFFFKTSMYTTPDNGNGQKGFFYILDRSDQTPIEYTSIGYRNNPDCFAGPECPSRITLCFRKNERFLREEEIVMED